ncbi:MAG: hypothetical protein JSW52_00195 [Candidatus Coatesbacteria bacterium]|nr:MAG: hypothetical protein JSW52_00195 [Candidatus Coatesbacteria bacterium]
MKVNLVVAMLLVPLVAGAQPPGPDGRGFPGEGRPDRENFDPKAMMDELMAESYDARGKVDYAADLLYPASETLFALVNEVTPLPVLSVGWDDIRTALADAFDNEELEAAEKNYLTYLEESGNRREALNDAWKDNDEREQIIGRLAESQDILVSVRYDVESAVEISKGARDDLKESSKMMEELKSMASRMPPSPRGDSRGPDEDDIKSLSVEIDAMDAAEEKAETQIKFGKDLLKKLGKIP